MDLSPAALNAIADAVADRLGRPSADSGLTTKRAAAQYLGLSVRTVEGLLARGALPSRVIGGRRLLPWPALREFTRHDHPGPVAPRPASRRAPEAK